MKPLLSALKEADRADVKFWISVLVRVAAVVLAEPGVIEIFARDFLFTLGVTMISEVVITFLFPPLSTALVSIVPLILGQ